MELIHMTAAYSNAVLLAVLPHISDLAKKLDLPIPVPVRSGQVIWARVSPYRDHVDAAVVLTSRYWFRYTVPGYIDNFRSPLDWFFEQDPAENFWRYLGRTRMTTNEVVTLARQALRRLGCTSPQVDGQPEVEGPFDIKAGHLPFCRAIWKWPPENEVSVDINTDHGEIMGLHLGLSWTNTAVPATPLRLDIVPELETDYQKRVKRRMFLDTNVPSILPPYKPPGTN